MSLDMDTDLSTGALGGELDALWETQRFDEDHKGPEVNLGIPLTYTSTIAPHPDADNSTEKVAATEEKKGNPVKQFFSTIWGKIKDFFGLGKKEETEQDATSSQDEPTAPQLDSPKRSAHNPRKAAQEIERIFSSLEHLDEEWTSPALFEQLLKQAYQARIDNRYDKAQIAREEMEINKEKLTAKQKEFLEVGKRLHAVIGTEKITSWADRIVTFGALILGGVLSLISRNMAPVRGALNLTKASTSAVNAGYKYKMHSLEGDLLRTKENVREQQDKTKKNVNEMGDALKFVGQYYGKMRETMETHQETIAAFFRKN